MRIPLAAPDITQREKELVLDVLNSGILGLGPKVQIFEKNFADYLGTKYAVACNSGTSGLHMLVHALGIRDGDEVITTPFSFIASSNCLLFERAKPVFVDIDERTYNLDVTQIESKITERTKAILPVHVFGQSADMTEINRLAKKYDLHVIEDACEAIGADWLGQKAGTFGDAGVFAFYPNKQLTTGEGGIIVTDNEELAQTCRSLRNQGRDEERHWLSHVRLGWNYRMDEMSAALGIAQLERVDELLTRRRNIARLYMEKLKGVPGITLPYVDPRAEMSWFVFVIRFDDQLMRDRVMQQLIRQGIGCRPYFSPIHLQPFYKEQFGYRAGDFPVTEYVAKGTLAIPFFNQLEEEQLGEVVATIRKVCISRYAVTSSKIRWREGGIYEL
mgnify:CR=1 FL=1